MEQQKFEFKKYNDTHQLWIYNKYCIAIMFNRVEVDEDNGSISVFLYRVTIEKEAPYFHSYIAEDEDLVNAIIEYAKENNILTTKLQNPLTL